MAGKDFQGSVRVIVDYLRQERRIPFCHRIQSSEEGRRASLLAFVMIVIACIVIYNTAASECRWVIGMAPDGSVSVNEF